MMDEWLMPGIPRTIAEDPDMETVRRIRAGITKDSGQVVESDLLLGCPFCGARPYIQTYEMDESCVDARVVCPRCHVSTRREYQSWRVWCGGDELTRTLAIGRAISLWNRRAERTCRMGAPIDGEYRCGECGHLNRETYRADKGWYPPEYCAHCGARVVKEEA